MKARSGAPKVRAPAEPHHSKVASGEELSGDQKQQLWAELIKLRVVLSGQLFEKLRYFAILIGSSVIATFLIASVRLPNACEAVRSVLFSGTWVLIFVLLVVTLFATTSVSLAIGRIDNRLILLDGLRTPELFTQTESVWWARLNRFSRANSIWMFHLALALLMLGGGYASRDVFFDAFKTPAWKVRACVSVVTPTFLPMPP